jgi:hypothetical protein
MNHRNLAAVVRATIVTYLELHQRPEMQTIYVEKVVAVFLHSMVAVKKKEVKRIRDFGS